MIRIFLNGLASSAGAGLTYLHNVIPHLSRLPDVHTTVAVQPNLRHQFDQLANIDVISPPAILGTPRRFWFEQCKLPTTIRKSGAQVLISAGNFALRNSPIPQILLSGNSLYISADFYKDLCSRRAYPMLIDNFVKGIFARKSVHWADRTIAPSQAFAQDLSAWTGKKIMCIYHGFDAATFFCSEARLPERAHRELKDTDGCLRLLFVSHYNYYRNFETLFRALPLIRKSLRSRKLKLLLTCKLQPGINPGTYDPHLAQELIDKLGISDSIVQLGAIPYPALHHLYRVCDIYVTAAYAETFAHPLVEAMTSGLPIVASDIPVHREICSEAAVYFPRFSSESLAENVIHLAESRGLADDLRAAGRKRSGTFSWERHVRELLRLASDLIGHPEPASTFAEPAASLSA